MDLTIFIVAISVSFVLGALVILFITMKHIFDSQSVTVERARLEASSWSEILKNKTQEFEEITKKASAANMSLGQSIIDFDLKIKDLENRVAMVRMQR